MHIINQIGKTDEIIISEYHFQDCVKRYAKICIDLGIKTLVDLELTDLFFYLYRQNYFVKENYNAMRYKEFLSQTFSKTLDNESIANLFANQYNEPYYGFEEDKKTKTI